MPVFAGDGRVYAYAPAWCERDGEKWKTETRRRVATDLDLAKQRTLEWAGNVYANHKHDPVRCDVVAHQESKTIAERIAKPKLSVWAFLSLAWTIYRVATLLWQLWNREPQPSDRNVNAILGLLERHYQDEPEGVAE